MYSARVKNTTARLRRTFHYPTDDDTSSNVTPEVLDEEEQEALIQSLAEQNASANHQYQILLAALPILASIPYLIALFRPATTLVALLGLTSLASTAFLLFSLPIAETGIPVLDAWARSPSSSTSKSRNTNIDYNDNHNYDDHDDTNRWNAVAATAAGSNPSGLGALSQMRHQRRRSSGRLSATTITTQHGLLTYDMSRSPLERYLPLLNIGLCAILALSGVYATTRGASGSSSGDDKTGGSSPKHLGAQFGWLGLGNLPTIVYGIVLLAKVLMANVDPEGELGALKYGYKGA